LYKQPNGFLYDGQGVSHRMNMYYA